MATGIRTAVRDLDFQRLRDARGREVVGYSRGAVVFHEGETTTDLYVVLHGAVELVVRDTMTEIPMIVRTIAIGEMFGEGSCFCERPRACTAIAREDTVVLKLPLVTVAELLARSPRFARGVIQTLCDRLEAGP